LPCLMRVSVSLITCLAANTVALGRLQDASTAPATPAATAAEKSPADVAFEPLRKAFNNLVQSLRNNGGMRKEDEPALRAMRDRAAGFSRQFADDPRGPAIELQLSLWLNDSELVADLYERLARLRPDDLTIPLSQAEHALNHHQFDRAVEVIEGHNFDPAKQPRAFVVLSDALLAQHKFVEAYEALKSIPPAALLQDPMVKMQVEEGVKLREGYEKQWEAEQALRAQEAAANDLPQAVIKTQRGDITVELFENQAPNTVANFVNLAEKQFYDGTKFHRVLPNFMAQGGDANSKEGATGTPGEGNPGYYIPDEVEREDHRLHFAGSLAMAKTAAPNTAGSQFYLTVTPTLHLNGKHTVFGRVLEGMDVVLAIQPDDVIESVTITRKREHPYEPTTLPLAGAATQPTTKPTTQPTTQPEMPPVPPVTTAPQTQPAVTAPAME
jgi:cyclophilin family peptidyl-prolyl cis-trans isomerase